MPGGLGHGGAAQVRQRLAVALAPGGDTVIADFTPAAFRDSSGAADLVTAPDLFRVVIPRRRLGDFLTPAGLAIYWSLYQRPAVLPVPPGRWSYAAGTLVHGACCRAGVD